MTLFEKMSIHEQCSDYNSTEWIDLPYHLFIKQTGTTIVRVEKLTRTDFQDRIENK